MKLKYIILLIVAFLSDMCFSQNMQEGFTYLETGKYKKAEVYFKTILKKFPNNKTARLCYGRSVGLHGDSDKALFLFKNLLTDFPNNFEIKLNY